MATNSKNAGKDPVESLQEVNLDDGSDSSSSSSDGDGEQESWDDEGGDQTPRAPAPSPIPLLPNPGSGGNPASVAAPNNNGVAPAPAATPPGRSQATANANKSPNKGKPPPQQQNTVRKKHPRPVEEDVSSRAAVALAAVAAAATANNTSPSAAAQAARAVAQSFVRGAKGGANSNHHSLPMTNPIMPNPPKNIPIRTVKLSLVKEQLLELCDGSQDDDENELTEAGENQTSNNMTVAIAAPSRYPFVERLAKGENDAFLQHLLMLAYYRATDEFPTGAELRPTVAIIDDDGNVGGGVSLGNVHSEEEEGDPDVDLAEEAANALISLWVTMEGAYTSMVSMLPKVHGTSSSTPDKRLTSLENKVLEVPSLESTSEDPMKDESLTDNISSASFDAQNNPPPSPEETDWEDLDKPVVVPDLLPPCTSARGDVTLEFFRACQGKHETAGDDDNTTTTTSGLDDSSSSGDRKQETTKQPAARTASTKSPPPPSTIGGGATSVLSNMFSAARRNSSGSVGSNFMSSTGGIMNNMKMPAGGFSVFRKGGRNARVGSENEAKNASKGPIASSGRPGEYTVQIEREMLGLTVENVLERTVVRTVLAGGPAKKAGAKVGSLIVKVGTVETKNLTHFETIDELRQSQRPLQLVLRLISDDALRSAREEMGRLIRGSGFGVITNGSNEPQQPAMAPDRPRGNGKDKNAAHTQGAAQRQRKRGETQGKPLIGSDLRADAYSSVIRERFLAIAETKNKKEETLERASEKLVWILSLFVMALEHESARLFSLAGTQENRQDDGSSVGLSASPRRSWSGTSSSVYHHTAKDYADAARSVAKILFDYVKKNLDPFGAKNGSQDYNHGRGKGPPSPEKNRRQPLVPGMQASPQSDSTILHDKPLLQIGDVLHRTRTFLVDPTSPPAALLRGELISFLCDVLDIDTEMELSEEESVTATTGGSAGSITDLGSAGSLLKLIVLNCSIMRSPECESLSSPHDTTDLELMSELKRHFGGRTNISSTDIHRLHAGNRFLSVVHRLAASRSTSARITACSLGPVLWGHLDFPHQLQLRGVITRALHDAEVIVRKSTATVLHEIAELVFDQRAVPWLILMCERAMTDPEPQLRSAAMTLTWHLAEHLPNAFLGDASQGSRFLRRLPNRSDPVFADVYLLQCKLLPVATRLAEDRAPSVRLAVAAQSDRLCSALGDHWSSVIIDALLALLTDADERVRCEAVLCVPRLAEIVLMSKTNGSDPITDVSVLEALLPAALMLQKDKVPQVRVALATSAGELLTLLVGLQSLEEVPPQEVEGQDPEPKAGSGRLKKHVDDVLIPLVQNLLHDKDPEVTSSALRAVTNASRGTVREIRSRQNTMETQDDVSVSSHRSLSSNAKERTEPVFMPVLSEDQVVRLFPTLSALGDSKQWRVRQSSVEIVPALLGCTRNIETRKEISNLCVRLMSDHVDAVRRTAAECLCLGGSSLGSHGEGAGAEWITSVVVPHVRRTAVHSNAKQRLLSLKMIEVVLLDGACPLKWKGDEEGERLADSPIRELAVVALSLANDNVPNVRLNVGRVLEAVIHVFEEDTLSFVKEVLLQQLGAEQERPGGGDRDVVFFASRCIHKARIILEEVSFTVSDDLFSIN